MALPTATGSGSVNHNSMALGLKQATSRDDIHNETSIG